MNMSETLQFLLAKRFHKMTSREAKAWAAEEIAEQRLEREKAKSRWLAQQLERTTDGRYHDLDAGKTAAEWEAWAEYFANEDLSPKG